MQFDIKTYRSKTDKNIKCKTKEMVLNIPSDICMCRISSISLDLMRYLLFTTSLKMSSVSYSLHVESCGNLGMELGCLPQTLMLAQVPQLRSQLLAIA